MNNRIKILHVISSLNRGGTERQLSILAINTNQEFYITLIAYFNKDKFDYTTEYDLNSFLIKINSVGFFRRLFEINKIINTNKPDVIYTWGMLESYFIFVLKPFHKFKFINGSLRHGIRSKNFFHYLRTVMLYLSKNVVSNSYAGLSANNLKPGKHRFVLYNGIEYKFQNILKENEISEKRNQLIPGFQNDPGTIYITIANLVAYKDYLTVIKALDKLNDITSFYYFIIGDGPMHAEVFNLLKYYNLEKRIFLIGKIENVRDYLFISDIMIHSSRGEGISNSILEGMFAGLPIIATQVGGIPETVYPGSSMLFPYKDDKALLDCLIKAPKVFAGFSKEFEDYKRHLAKFSVKTMINNFEMTINSVVEIPNNN